MTQRTYGLTQLLGHGYAFTQRLVVPSPASGAGFTYTNNKGYIELLDSLSFQILTSSQSANRLVTLTVKDGDGVALATVPANAALTASKTGQYTFLQNFSGSLGATDGPFLSVAPLILLQQTWTLTVGIGGVDTADQVSNIRLTMERFVTGPEGYPMGVTEEDDGLDTLTRIAALVG